MRKVPKHGPQASQRAYDDRMIYRWYVHFGRKKADIVVTWAATADEARERGQARGRKVLRVTPAPRALLTE